MEKTTRSSGPKPETRLFIHGEFVEAAGGASFTVREPATGKTYARVSQAGPEDLERAVRAARRTFDDRAWPGMAPFDRGRLLRRIAGRIVERAEEIAEVETRSGGKTIANSLNEAGAAARVFEYYAGAMDKFFGETIPLGDGILDFTLREPVGVVGQITPWNFPFMAAAWKAAPALAAGCTVILKPASYTPLTTLLLADIAREADLPPGVLNVLPGPGRGLGDRFAVHPRIDKVAFTGATGTGTQLLEKSAESLKRISLELGGKSPNIVFADADLEKAAREAVTGGFGNAGQSCSARTRLFIEAKAHDRFLELFVDATRAFRLGDPLKHETQMGPLISEGARRSVEDYVASALEEGAELAFGGKRPVGLGDGSYYLPTILARSTNAMRASREEIFGPVVSVIPFRNETEVVGLANDNAYGLNASVWSRDINKALRVAKALRCGMVSVNSHGSASRYGLFTPFGGYKKSGIGRELGMHGLALYTEIKNVFVDLRD